MITWNYRVIHKIENGEHTYAIHEVYYNENGEPWNVTVNSTAPLGETLQELLDDLEHYIDAINRPILEFDGINTNQEL